MKTIQHQFDKMADTLHLGKLIRPLAWQYYQVGVITVVRHIFAQAEATKSINDVEKKIEALMQEYEQARQVWANAKDALLNVHPGKLRDQFEYIWVNMVEGMDHQVSRSKSLKVTLQVMFYWGAGVGLQELKDPEALMTVIDGWTDNWRETLH